MSWFGRDSPLRSSFSKRRYSFTPFQKISEGTCLEVFKSHWQQAWGIMTKYGHGQPPNSSLGDDISSVVNLLDQMTTLLLQETQLHPSSAENSNGNNSELKTVGPILDFFLSESCLDKLLTWSTHTGEYVNVLKLEQLKLYEVLVTNCHQDLLFHKPVVRPLLRLLSSCRECAPVEVEKRLVILLNSLCVCITQFPDLLQVFFRASSDHGATRSENPRDMFLIFSLLIPFVHREGCIGQQARDALLLCMSLSRKDENIGMYIAEHSNFCPVLATGLSGLYSVLPRKLPIVSEDWHCFTQEDIAEMPELSMFLNSLEFCNAVIQVAHPMVQEQLLEYLYQGFLVPVLGPALHQDAVGIPVGFLESSPRYVSTVEEIIATTAYLELFLRTVTEPILLQVFLKFILTSSHEDHDILNTLTDRLGAQGQLCLVTMALFHRLLDLNCEDVLFQLVLRFLIPCCHIMVSQRSRIRDIDIYSSSAEKFLALIPNCCSPVQKTVSADVEHRVLPLLNSPHQFVPGDLRSISMGDRLSKGGSLRVKTYRRSPSTSSLPYGELDRGQPLSLLSKDWEVIPPLESAAHSGYLDYLKEAHESIKSCTVACRTWSALYDGCDPSPEAYKEAQKRNMLESKNHIVILNGFHPISAKRTENGVEVVPAKVLEASSTGTSAQKESSQTVKSTTEEDSTLKAESPPDMIDQFIATLEDKVSNENNDIFSQLAQANDENDFWSLIGSTETPLSMSDVDESLESIDSYLRETEESALKYESKSNVNIMFTCTKEDSGSNMDSGVFESRESNSSSDRDNDTEISVLSGAKKLEEEESAPSSSTKCLLKKEPLLSLAITPKVCTHPSSTWELFGSPDVGPFLSILLTRLEMMMQNDVYTNLHLTGLISRLACYPQSLLRSFLLNHSLVFQPTVRSLLQVLGSLKHKVDSYSCTVENFDELVKRSRRFLLAREDYFFHNGTHMSSKRMNMGRLHDGMSGMKRSEPRRRSLTNFLFRRGSFLKGKAPSVIKEPTLESIAGSQGYRYVPKPTVDPLEGEMESVKTKNAVFCALILEEFLKELAAIALEHSVIQLDPDFWDKKWQTFL